MTIDATRDSDMSESPQSPNGRRPPRGVGFPNPWSGLKRRLDDRFKRRREEIRSYLEVATPIALEADRLYREWREAVADPVQDGQKAANRSAGYWWHVTDDMRRFNLLVPPPAARRFHGLLADALWNASQGSEIAKNGFRNNKFSEVSRGLGFLDSYLELMAEAERETRRLLKKFHLD